MRLLHKAKELCSIYNHSQHRLKNVNKISGLSQSNIPTKMQETINSTPVARNLPEELIKHELDLIYEVDINNERSFLLKSSESYHPSVNVTVLQNVATQEYLKQRLRLLKNTQKNSHLKPDNSSLILNMCITLLSFICYPIVTIFSFELLTRLGYLRKFALCS